MLDTRWPACHVVAALLWLTAAVLAVLNLFITWDVGALAMLAAAGGGVIHVRCWFKALEARELAAFELGREAGVRSLR